MLTVTDRPGQLIVVRMDMHCPSACLSLSKMVLAAALLFSRMSLAAALLR